MDSELLFYSISTSDTFYFELESLITTKNLNWSNMLIGIAQEYNFQEHELFEDLHTKFIGKRVEQMYKNN